MKEQNDGVEEVGRDIIKRTGLFFEFLFCMKTVSAQTDCIVHIQWLCIDVWCANQVC